MKLASIIVLSLVLTPSVVRAEWVKVAKSNQGTKAYVDIDSINRFGDNVVFWHKATDGRDRTMSQLAASCSTGQFQRQQLIVNGVTSFTSNGKPFPVKQAPMGSVIGASIQFACGNH